MNEFHSSVELKNVSGVLAHATKVSVGSKMTLDLTEEKKNVKKKDTEGFFLISYVVFHRSQNFYFWVNYPLWAQKNAVCKKLFYLSLDETILVAYWIK